MEQVRQKIFVRKKLYIYYHEARRIEKNYPNCDGYNVNNIDFFKTDRKLFRLLDNKLIPMVDSFNPNSIVVIDKFVSTGELLIIDEETMKMFIDFVGKDKIILHMYKFPVLDDFNNFTCILDFESHYLPYVNYLSTAIYESGFRNISKVFDIDDSLIFLYSNKITKPVIKFLEEYTATSAFISHADKIYEQNVDTIRKHNNYFKGDIRNENY